MRHYIVEYLVLERRLSVATDPSPQPDFSAEYAPFYAAGNNPDAARPYDDPSHRP